MKQILGYANVWRVIPGAKISFKVSTYGPERYRADLVRVICGDDEPEHGIFREEEIDAPFNGEYPGRFQPIEAGSYGVVPPSAVLDALESFTVQSWVFATTPKKGEQGLIAQWRDDPATGFALLIDDTGSVAMRVGDGVGGVTEISTGAPLAERRWYLVSGSYDASRRELSVSQKPIASTLEGLQAASARGAASGFTCTNTPLMFAAFPAMLSNGKPGPRCHFNGKIDRPRLSARVLSSAEVSTAAAQENPHDQSAQIVAAWDFSRGFGTDAIQVAGPNVLHVRSVYLPSRG
jgi:N,N-dimethylformamidase